MSDADPHQSEEPINLGDGILERLANALMPEFARLQYEPVDYGRMHTGTAVPDLTDAKQSPGDLIAIRERSQTLASDLEFLREARQPFDLFGGERSRRYEALAAAPPFYAQRSMSRMPPRLPRGYSKQP